MTYSTTEDDTYETNETAETTVPETVSKKEFVNPYNYSLSDADITEMFIKNYML